MSRSFTEIVSTTDEPGRFRGPEDASRRACEIAAPRAGW